MRLLTQEWQPSYNYCDVCGCRLVKATSITCTGKCYAKIQKLNDAIDKRLEDEKGGVKLNRGIESAEFEMLQFELAK